MTDQDNAPKEVIKQHDYEVTLTITIIVNNAESKKEAEDAAINLICDDPKEYSTEFEVIGIEDLGESKMQF